MNVTSCLLHDFLDVVAAFADNVTVIGETDVHLQRRPLRLGVQLRNNHLFCPLHELTLT